MFCWSKLENRFMRNPKIAGYGLDLKNIVHVVEFDGKSKIFSRSQNLLIHLKVKTKNGFYYVVHVLETSFCKQRT